MEDFSKEMEYGNFQDLDRFPLDCESMAMMQSTLRHYAAIAQIAGYDLLILSGCEVSGGFREEGYVFVKKNGTLTGEILFHPKAVQQSTCSISEIKYDVQADGETFGNAYSKRRLIEGGNEFSWSEVVNLSSVSNKALLSKLYSLSNSLSSEQSAREAAVQSLKETLLQQIRSEVSSASSTAASSLSTEVTALKSQISTLTEKINTEITQRTAADNNIEKSIVPKGVILMWSGTPYDIPSGWALCDGQEGRPDLRGRFILGACPSNDVNRLNYTHRVYGAVPHIIDGKERYSITLATENLPKHTHTAESKITCYKTQESGSDNQIWVVNNGNDVNLGSTNFFVSTNIGSTGEGKPYDMLITPPYYALCYIMKL